MIIFGIPGIPRSPSAVTWFKNMGMNDRNNISECDEIFPISVMNDLDFTN